MDYEEESERRLTNDDFRKLLMTPRSSIPAAIPSSVPQTPGTHDTVTSHPEEDDRAEARRKKKSFYAKLKKQEECKMAELAEKYRDRAKERREGTNQDYQAEDPLASASGYRAVAPDVKSGLDAAERRRQMIQESKFLGGDMEHTHLVKGLDYALLQKVRSEIQVKEQEQEEEMEKLVSKPKKEKKKEEEEMQFKTRLGRNVYRVALGNFEVERNPMFAPGRMAYVVDLQEEMIDSDIPTTLIRSKADVPSFETTPTLTTNDIVINKLAQILSYLRQGPRQSKKSKRKDKAHVEEPIYPDLTDYVPSTEKRSESKKKTSKYFASDEREEKAAATAAPAAPTFADIDKKKAAESKKDTKAVGILSRLAAEPTGYAECYPGQDEMQDAIDDSDDEVDYTKMDLGNKKGPVGRWDFDTQEEYSQYMNTKEALPKAAFQYGVKMADGRRTRKYNKEKNERAELDREWNKIQNIIQKRKAPEKDGSSHFKMPKY
ncbi:protein Red [Nilaparvata lugens]|uniref:protein Red n=1 Tax=Nilaparvata lugens TaxID=108931 RepID=UPI000B98EC0C|nr:protein Red [Nilaparvata lugens]